jgi:hypothetical protein
MQNIQNFYIENFPTELPIKIAQGFIVTAAIGLVAGCASNVVLLRGAVAVTATIIEAVTRPIIRAIFPQNPFIATGIQVFIPEMIALSLTASVAPWIGVGCRIGEHVLSLPSIIAWFALNHRCYERNVAMAAVL